MMIIKRDGSKEEFDINKIYNAVDKAFKACNKEGITEDVKKAIKFELANKATQELEFTVELVQDLVENILMGFTIKHCTEGTLQEEKCTYINYEYKDVAKAYIIYRYEHSILRKNKNSLVEAISKKLEATNIDNQNANVDEYSFGGRIGEAGRIVTKEYALLNCMSKKSRKNHENNEIYIHDLDSYATGMHNCLSIPFDDLLAKGFKTRQVDIRPANSINTAFQLVAVIFQVQSLQQFGGVSATHLDWTMVPYVKKSFCKHYKDGLFYIKHTFDMSLSDELSIKDSKYSDEDVYKYAKEMTTKELKQAVEGLYHNLNSLQSRSGNQLPFTSINYGTCTSPEGRMVIKALLEGSIKGVGFNNATPIFPCGIFQYSKEINGLPDTPNYDMYILALRSTSLRMYPNYANIEWSGNTGYDKNDPRTYFSTMGCRTANGYDINGFGQLKDGRGNICPVTIIMPTLAMEANRDVETFFKLLDKKIKEAKDMLLERFEWICSQSPKSAKFMWDNNTMAGYIPEEGIRSALKHGTLALGNLGLAETLQLLIGKDHTTKEGMDLAKLIYNLFKTRCAEFKEKYKLNFGVYNTPAENLCYTAMKKFKAKYGEIPNVSDKDYFTNSMHIPVWHQITPFEKIDLESQLTGYSSAGCITYVELDSSVKHNIEALETIVNYAMDKDIPYFAINIPNDQCKSCGYIDEIGDTCPKCGSDDINRLRRVTGYLSTDYHNFNLGKQDEVEHRVKHIKEIE